MTRRLAGAVSLIVFAACLLIGGIQADNPFTTTVLRALTAMAVTFVIGLVIGWMAERMLQENLQEIEKKLKETAVKSSPEDR
jgi:NhaP-type Na+/H+ or K+/H+ antiporter